MNRHYRVLAVAATILYCTPILRAQTVADVARDLRARRQAESQTATPVTADQVEQKELQYRRFIQSLLARDAVAEIDAEADAARMSKERFGGGVWKLYVLYTGLTAPAGGDRASDEVWAAHLGKLEAWVRTRSQSITARVALAEGYRFLGWRARGQGKADTVSDSAWQLLREQDAKALVTLAGAAGLAAKCPHWYFVMLEIARDQSFDATRTRELFEAAAAFEPDYYHSYREYSNNLLPKWNGEPGDAEAFAEESNKHLGGARGAFVYFEIATVLYCACVDETVQPTLDWDTIKTGFAEMDKQYGATITDLNRFAALAYLYRDRDVTRRTLLRVGDRWDSSVWRRRDVFDKARFLAGLPN